MISLTKEQIIMIHQALIEATGGSQGVRDGGMLESALAAPFATYGEEEFFPTVEEKAARLAIGLVNNHPMIDGNKRIGAYGSIILRGGFMPCLSKVFTNK
jgi:death-on-curing protein